ncbi:uncharacterized protein [Rutidosis leptorrhynchoides]|uniref:uncharacterized protein n=1 Tax=Rutidosis leptorrhynchoides TaxID=125765 RepID=UPI003A998665
MDKTFKMLEFLIDDSDDENIVSFVNSLTQEEVDGKASSSRVPRSRVYIARDREDAAIRECLDATGRQSLTILQKCTAAIRQMAYGTTPDLFDEYIKIWKKTAALCLENFCQCVFHLFARQYLRKPTAEYVTRLYNVQAQKYGLSDMLCSINYMHWEWNNGLVAWQGQYIRGSNNDINVLNFSPLFNTIKDGIAPPSPFEVNGRRYERGYYLGDGIYPDCAMLVKAPHNPTDEPRKKFKRFQESARKDIERAFGVLHGRFVMLKTPARSFDLNKIRRHMYACIVLHNMIQENNSFVIGRREERMIQRNPPRRLERNLRDRDARIKEIRDKQVHKQLKAD